MKRKCRNIYRILPLALLVMALPWLAGCNIPTRTETNRTTATTHSGESETTAETSGQSAINRLISPEEARQKLADDPDIVLLDVRTPAEYADGHIPDSQLLPYDEIETRLDELPDDKSTPIIIYCRSGNRSAIAARVLADLGFTELYDLGGIISWPYEIVTD